MSEKTITPRQFVRSKEPTAFCESNGSYHQVVVMMGMRGANAVGRVIGWGSNPRRAWAAAARRAAKVAANA